MASSDGGTVADADADSAPQLYFCHQCNRTVTVNLSPNSDLLCPTCNGGFLEEYEGPIVSNPSPSPSPFVNPFADSFSRFLSSFPFFISRPPSSMSIPLNPITSTPIFAPTSPTAQTRNDPQEPPAFDPLIFFQDYIGSLRAGGANIQLVIENHHSEGLPLNLSDFFMGQGLEQLIHQLTENDPHRYGTPPASKSAVEALPSVTVHEKLLSSELAQCAVCQDDFEKDMVVKQMPCKHAYHSECIMPWLELHNSCPVCRYELPTDDPDYENRSRGTASSGSNTSNANVRSDVLGSGSDTGEDEENVQVRQIVERTFSVLLGPLRGFRDGNTGDNNDGNSASGGHQNRDSN